MTDAPPQVIAEFNDYSGLVMAIRTRVEQLGVPISTLDEIAGLPTRYVSKIIGPAQVRRFSMQSLTPILWTLGIKLQVVEDGNTAHYKSRLSRRRVPMHNGTVHILVNRDHYRRIGALGGAASRKYLSKRVASQLGRKAAYARWSRVREAQPV